MTNFLRFFLSPFILARLRAFFSFFDRFWKIRSLFFWSFLESVLCHSLYLLKQWSEQNPSCLWGALILWSQPHVLHLPSNRLIKTKSNVLPPFTGLRGFDPFEDADPPTPHKDFYLGSVGWCILETATSPYKVGITVSLSFDVIQALCYPLLRD